MSEQLTDTNISNLHQPALVAEQLIEETTNDALLENFRQKVRGEILALFTKNVATDKLETKKAHVSPGNTEVQALKKLSPSDAKKVEEDIDEFEDACKPEDVVGDRFVIRGKLRQGGYGQIYSAVDKTTNTKVAIKCEKIGDSSNRMEQQVLKSFQGKLHCPIFYASGLYGENTYIALQLLGKNLSEIRRSCQLNPPRLSLKTCFKSVLQCLKAIEELHQIGYLHRDVKPSNFVVGLGHYEGRIYMIDFGLCRYYKQEDGLVKPPRMKVGFRGTVRYASLTAHEQKEISRKDDLWSLFYSMCELYYGYLPWRKTNNKDTVAEFKKECTPELMCKRMPTEISEFVEHLRSLQYMDEPQYELLSDILNQILKNLNAVDEEDCDWQVPDCRIFLHFHYLKRKPTALNCRKT